MANLVDIPNVLFNEIINFVFEYIEDIASILSLINKKIQKKIFGKSKEQKIIFKSIKWNHKNFTNKKKRENIHKILTQIKCRFLEYKLDKLDNLFLSKLSIDEYVKIEITAKDNGDGKISIYD